MKTITEIILLMAKYLLGITLIVCGVTAGIFAEICNFLIGVGMPMCGYEYHHGEWFKSSDIIDVEWEEL